MVTTTDLSGLIGMAKMSGEKVKRWKKMGEQKKIRPFPSLKYADSLEGMTAEEKTDQLRKKFISRWTWQRKNSFRLNFHFNPRPDRRLDKSPPP